MEPGFPTVEAVAVRGDRIVAVGTLQQVEAAVGPDHTVDDRFRDRVVLPGLIDQHLHPLLGATTLATEVIATEDWLLPERTFPAAHSPEEYRARLSEAEIAMSDGVSGEGDAVPGEEPEWLLSWGYHAQWHGPLDRTILDEISRTRPIGIWQRSCHEWYLNSAGIEALGITEERLAGRGHASDQVSLDRGHFWEAGFFNIVMPMVAPILISRERITRGLHQLVTYLRQHGVTAFNEPGIAWAFEPWDLYQEILGADDAPFRSTFMVDGRTQAAKGMSAEEAIADAEAQVARCPDGKVSMIDKHVKLFADGAIISQLMQMKDPYLDADGLPNPEHHGEWLMEPDRLHEYFAIYWDAGWQIHTHVNGDLGLEIVLDALEACMIRSPRADHRSVIVHFANSTEDQVERIARLGAIVSANPYYPCGFADKYGELGLGAERADVMVRSRSVLDRGVPLSFHSDLPMAPARPLGLAASAVHRRTQSGRVAGPEQRISVQEALRAVTIGAAHSWRMEHELGSIAPGKLATFTVLDADPLGADATPLEDIGVVGTFFEGKWFDAPVATEALAVQTPAPAGVRSLASVIDRSKDHEHVGCTCEAAGHLVAAYRSLGSHKPAA